MSYEELDRVGVIERVIQKRLTQREAARILGLTSRQVRRLCRGYERSGARALASRHRGRPSNRRLPSERRREALATVRSRYEGFGPTLAHEKLTERHGLRLSVETLRHWMIEDGLWVPRARREPRIQQPRHRRPCRGDLVQIDGCDHDWFEERAGRCTLLVFVDDATGALMELRFCESESAFSYFAAMRSYLEQHGKPVALYSDKATVFRVNKKEPQGGTGVTQFSRALSSLNIDILCANTPAAKGRVERAHLTLQDRLVKELRLRGISDVEAANAFAPEFIADYNRRSGALRAAGGRGARRGAAAASPDTGERRFVASLSPARGAVSQGLETAKEFGGGGGNRTRVRIASSERVYVCRHRSLSVRPVSVSGGGRTQLRDFLASDRRSGGAEASPLMTPATR